MTVLLYGATGYTGRLVAREAARRGLPVTLAGRDAAKLAPLAEDLRLPFRAFGLAEAAGKLGGFRAVLNAAGPFRRTAAPLVAAALASGAHYLDLAGEVPEFEALVARDAEARRAGVMLLPGVGFGVVPTDLLAAHLLRRLPGATRLTLAFHAGGGVSRGTAETVVPDLAVGGVARRGGRLVPEMAGVRRRRFDFGAGEVVALSNPWRGDLSAVYHSTGVPDVEAYTVMPAPLGPLARASRALAPLLRLRAVQNALLAAPRRGPEGPSDAERAVGFTRVWAEAADPTGRTAHALLSGPDAYDFTATSAVRVAEHVLGGGVLPGFQTPARLLGPEFLLGLTGVERRDV